nr:DUF898 family protein [uncultured Desulfuromonas sp.]
MPTIRCPECSYSKDTSPSIIPTGCYLITCPICGHTFPPEQADKPPKTASSGTTEIREIPFTFHGKGGEYFGIWIVNTLLKVLTLGFYSPWAKVRKRRYLYGNTQLENHPFDYVADPWVLFRGFLIGVVLFVGYTVLNQFNPLLALPFALVFFLAMPWLIVRSRMFNNRNTSHRNLRFSFAPNYREAYLTFGLLPILTTATLGLAAPYVLYRQKRFLMENNHFGQTPFCFEATVGEYYQVFLRLVGLGLLTLMIVAATGYAGVVYLAPAAGLSTTLAGEGRSEIFAISFVLMFFLLSMASSLYLYVRLNNLNWNRTHLDGHYFNSTLSVRAMAWIFLSNLVAISLSAGLLIPWATIRLTRYRFENLSLIAHGSLDHFVAGKDEEVSAIGEEIGDIFDVEIGL